MAENIVPDHELPDELPERFQGHKKMVQHLNFGRDGGAGLYRWYDTEGRAWPIQEQYDTRKPKARQGKSPAVKPSKTGVVIIDRSQPSGFYGEVVPSYRELREIWKQWRAEKKAAAEVKGGGL